ncbi:hybrid sensor histidine kinase/response regulator [Desulfofustis limnaeus]|jgi:PAS domain S-box-containing protein|uniref:histidine kinase n=1 Tax=Desulfofustis limnaeus TaxID=2740163 RepID=A0ABM7W5V3_9BACT|nr:response regulator [Desulfofustis limnaeus]MDX9896644.1 response regulator [Desulfofustis sp.]BDD86261.1 hypothetical protein DPPLL_06260 [Desulfofustis limnaeus]
MRILVVDDRQDSRYLLEVLLTAHGHQILTACHGAEALQKLGQEDVELIVSDILMPVMDGFQLCQTVKKDETLRRIPFLFYTATYTGSKDEDLALRIGADAFLQKPCEPEVFINVINKLAVGGGRDVATDRELADEEELLVLYNQRLVRKLEQKMVEAEREIEERKKVEAALRQSQQHLMAAQRLASIGDFTWDVGSGEVSWSHSLCELLGYDDLFSFDHRQFDDTLYHPDDRDRVRRWLEECLHSGQERLTPLEYRVLRKDGTIRFVRTVGTIDRRSDKGPQVFATVQDITETKLIEAQLLQAQKLESIGRLAGGVAHDYNNMLSVIIGYAELALSRVAEGDSLRSDLQEILAAAGRSRDITRQLLAFARKESISPVVLDLNEAVGVMLKVLRRLIGEDIDLVWMPGAELWPVKMDPAQLDQMLANLCVNARDAIADVGKITIETKRVTMDQAYYARHLDSVPGDFVMLAVADDGCGMDRATLDQIFEPFFTTKDVGRGTGLGLATVYGIVQQNNGFINVYSEPSQGTVFSIYLPRHRGALLEQTVAEAPQQSNGNGELILVVEDEAAIMRLTERILGSLNYRVVIARTVSEALGLAQRHGDELALLITDVVMPEMNGRDLADRLRSRHPHLKCLFMSGYTADVIAHRGILEQDVHFIQKPFSRNDLARTVRSVLDA